MDINHVMRFDSALLHEDADRFVLRASAPRGDARRAGQIADWIRPLMEPVGNGIEPRAVISRYDGGEAVLSGRTLRVGGVDLECPAFEKLDPRSIKGVFIFLITIGRRAARESSPTDQYAADLVETAFVDALRIQVQKLMGEDTRLSEEFGPGLYGMDMGMMHRLQQLADASLVGIEIKESGMLVPAKSCGLIRFAVSEGYKSPGPACAYCRGASGGCSLCLFGADRLSGQARN